MRPMFCIGRIHLLNEEQEKKERDKEHQETPKNQREKNAQQHKNSIVTFQNI
jgi:ATP sulfurylase